MKVKPLLFLLIFSLPLFAQETKKRVKNYINPSYQEVYYVLKSDNSTRHGSFKTLGYKKAILIEGYYKNGLKDSLWVSYHWGSSKKKEQGMYLDDKRIGVWEFYDPEGNLEQKYDYSKNELVYFAPSDLEFRTIQGQDTITTKLDRPPLFIGGSSMFYELLGDEMLKYSLSGIQRGKSGKVLIEFVVDKNGWAINHRIYQGTGTAFDEMALKIAKSIPRYWHPGLLQGEPVSVVVILPLAFNIY